MRISDWSSDVCSSDLLMKYGWIKDARVSRRLPDTLVVDIVERTPAAIWQHNNRLSLIDEKGVVLEPVTVATMPDLPLVIGPRANQRSQDLARLLASASSLKELRSEEHTSELQSLLRISYAVFCLKKKKTNQH